MPDRNTDLSIAGDQISGGIPHKDQIPRGCERAAPGNFRARHRVLPALLSGPDIQRPEDHSGRLVGNASGAGSHIVVLSLLEGGFGTRIDFAPFLADNIVETETGVVRRGHPVRGPHNGRANFDALRRGVGAWNDFGAPFRVEPSRPRLMNELLAE